MNYGSVCSGIEAATEAWHPLGWDPVFFSEIDPFPRAILKERHPDVPLHGDFTTIEEKTYGPIRLLVGGTPCQSFSLAGLRKGMDDDRGNLALEYLRLAARTRATWLVWENVPGVLSSSGGRDFGAFLGGLVELGYGFAYRVLDAQYFGVPQRRRRVFVVGYLGDWRPAAAVLFERHSMQGHPAPSRQARENTPPAIAKSLKGNSGGIDREDGHTLIPARMRGFGDYKTDEVASSLKSRDYKDHTDLVMGFSGVDHGQDATEETSPTLRAMPGKRPNGGGQVAVAFAIRSQESNGMKSDNPKVGHKEAEIAKTIDTTYQDPSKHQGGIAVAFQPRYARNDWGAPDTVAAPLTAEAGKTGKGDSAQCVAWSEELNASEELAGTINRGGEGGRHDGVMAQHSVRRLTPIECERLQGFPDNHTQIEWRGKPADQCPDGPRYKAIGNSMAVPVMHWIGQRIQKVEELI